jgi:glycosyltransferase involved in cell wall biosynthesis
VKFTIITPSFNRHQYLDDTIRSVITQRGDFEIEYIIQDGCSNEEVIELLEKWKRHIDSDDFRPDCRRLSFDYYVESDSGMYEAINKGFEKGTGDLLAWINSDDMYFPNAFESVHQALRMNKNVDWVIGKAATFDSRGRLTDVAKYPNAYSREFVRRGYYRADLSRFRWISQDSVFWRRSLWEVAGPLATHHRLVSDFKLWQSFARHARPTKIETLIAGYRFHGNQLTGDPDAYLRELGEMPGFPFGLPIICNGFRAIPFMKHLLKFKIFRARLAGFLGVKPVDVVGQKLSWDEVTGSWILSEQSVFP